MFRHKTFQDRENVYLLMEYVPGGEFFNYIRQAVQLSNPVARFYTAEIVLAIEHLHNQKILYRDLKPVPKNISFLLTLQRKTSCSTNAVTSN
jgi:serine/threonine protein kinase